MSMTAPDRIRAIAREAADTYRLAHNWGVTSERQIPHVKAHMVRIMDMCEEVVPMDGRPDKVDVGEGQ